MTKKRTYQKLEQSELMSLGASMASDAEKITSYDAHQFSRYIYRVTGKAVSVDTARRIARNANIRLKGSYGNRGAINKSSRVRFLAKCIKEIHLALSDSLELKALTEEEVETLTGIIGGKKNSVEDKDEV